MAVDISNLPAPPSGGADISALPPPPSVAKSPDIASLPEPPSQAVAQLPIPPKSPEEHPTPTELSDRDFEEIAAKHGVDPQDLRQLAPYYGVNSQTEGGLPGAVGEAAKYTAGSAGRMALGIPQFVYKKLQDQPMRHAIDELTEIGNKQRGYIESGAEMVALPIGGPAGAEGRVAETGLKASAGRIAHGAAVGAGIGAVNAPEGQELRGAATGAAFGGVLSTAGEAVGKVLARRAQTKAEQALLPRVGSLELDRKADEIAARTAESEKAIGDSVLRSTEISPEAAQKIVSEQSDPELLKEVTSSSNELGHMVAQGTEGRSEVIQKLAQNEVDNRIMGLAREIEGTSPRGLEEARKVLDTYTERQGGEQALTEKYQDFLRGQQIDKAIEDTGARTQSQDKWWSKLLNFFSGNQFVNRDIDDRFGTKTEQILGQATANNNRATFASKAFSHELDSIDQQAEKLGLGQDLHSPEVSGKIRNALDTGNLDGLSPQETQVTQRLRNYADKFLDFVNGLNKAGDREITPLSIPKRENWFPHVLKDTPEIVNLVQQKMDTALEKISQMEERPITDLSQLNQAEFREALKYSPELRDISQAMSILGQGRELTRPQDFSSQFKQAFYERPGRVAIETSARSANERAGGIPNWMLETDVMKALDKYTRNTLRHLYLRRPMDQLRIAAQNIRNAGGSYEANYLERLLQDQLGIRKSTAAEAQLQTGVAFMNAMDRIADENPKLAPAAKAAKAVPAIMQNMVRGLFANVLGYRTRPLFMHGTQTLTKLMPELGVTPYGSYAALRGVVGAALDFKGMYAEAERLGNVTVGGHMDKSQALARGIQRSLAYKVPANTLGAINNIGMIPFEKMIQANRAVAVSTAKVMAHDLVNGSAGASKALSNFPRNIQAAVHGVATELEKSDILGRYLNAVTQYNYDRMNMSEFGRTMGPLFSAFSTWPTNTLGDIVYEFRNKGVIGGAMRNTEKYVAPFAMLYAVDFAIRHHNRGGEMSDRQKALMGGGGLTSTAPIGSLGAFLKGEAITPPVINAITETVVHPLMEATKHPDRAQQTFMKGFSNSLNSFAPAAGLVHFVTDDLVTYITGHRPEGGTQLERTQEGARILNKKLNR